tara:strand:- start:15 stop:434 length:420 start_codon:yes stop_codon:yes gene_type:complete
MNILFLCVGNSARSQIAEGLAKEMFGTKNNIQSAGSNPAGHVHPCAISTLKDIGIDINEYKSKSIDDLDEEFKNNLDYVITLCSEEICPILPGDTNTLHWINEDPVNAMLNDEQLKIAFKKTRDNIFNLLKKFMIENDL